MRWTLFVFLKEGMVMQRLSLFKAETKQPISDIILRNLSYLLYVGYLHTE